MPSASLPKSLREAGYRIERDRAREVYVLLGPPAGKRWLDEDEDRAHLVRYARHCHRQRRPKAPRPAPSVPSLEPAPQVAPPSPPSARKPAPPPPIALPLRLPEYRELAPEEPRPLEHRHVDLAALLGFVPPVSDTVKYSAEDVQRVVRGLAAGASEERLADGFLPVAAVRAIAEKYGEHAERLRGLRLFEQREYLELLLRSLKAAAPRRDAAPAPRYKEDLCA